MAMRQFFLLLQSGRPMQSPTIDVAVAVATDGGLMTPIVANTDKLQLTEINAAVGSLAKKAR